MAGEKNTCKTWRRLEIKEQDGSILKLRIQDLPLDRTDEAVEFLVNNYMKEEAFQVAAGIYKNEEAAHKYRKLKRKLIENSKASIVMCYFDNNDSKIAGKIIGLSCMVLQKNTEKNNKEYAQKASYY